MHFIKRNCHTTLFSMMMVRPKLYRRNGECRILYLNQKAHCMVRKIARTSYAPGQLNRVQSML